jgi:hypothetical protein
MRRRKVLRWLCSARLSGNDYLLMGALFAVVLPFVPLFGPALAPLVAAVGTIMAAVLMATIVGALLGPVVL